MISIGLFNNKGGVGKTTLTYHLAHMLARLEYRVLAVDLDPQANLTSIFMDEDDLAVLWGEAESPAWSVDQAALTTFPVKVSADSATVADAINPIVQGLGDITIPAPVPIDDSLWLLPGDLRLSTFEDRLSESWPKTFIGDDPAAFRITTAFHRMVTGAAAKVEADLVLIDVGPNLGAINRAALLAADTVLTPLAADLFSLRGLHNLGPTFRRWRNNWQQVALPNAPPGIPAPAARMEPVGYVIMQPVMRLDRPVQAYRRWLDRIPSVYASAVLGRPDIDGKEYEVATLRNYQSLMPLAHDARKPMFDLRAADGAKGSTQTFVQRCYQDFRRLAQAVVARVESPIAEPPGPR